jgi:periplasmic protein TonB
MRVLLLTVAAIAAALFVTGSTLVKAQGEQVYRPGNGVTLPVVTYEVRPQYTSEAMKAKIKGSVLVELTVTSKGEVTDVEVTRSLDRVYGLDDNCVAAAKQWKFKPGTKDGKPVAVRVHIENTFTMR